VVPKSKSIALHSFFGGVVQYSSPREFIKRR
jgi:hypothetical protein